MLGKKLDSNFKEVDKWQDARYLIHDDGEVELLWDAVGNYMILSAEEIIKLAEIVKDMELEEEADKKKEKEVKWMKGEVVKWMKEELERK